MAAEPVDHINERDRHIFDLRERFRIALVEAGDGFAYPLSKEDLSLLVEVLTDDV